MKKNRLFILFLVILLSACSITSPNQDSNDYNYNEDEYYDEYEYYDEDGPFELMPAGEAVACSSTTFTPLTSLEVFQKPEMDEPPPRQPYIDPVFGTCVVRVTDRNNDLSPGDSSRGIKNEYSRVQSFNADGTYLIARGIEATWYLYDAASLTPLAELPLWDEPRWDATNPNLIYYFDEARLMAFDIEAGERQLIHDFAPDFPSLSLSAVWTRYEGSPSKDTRYWGLMAQDEDWNVAAFLVYDLVEDEVIAKRLTPEHPEVDSVTISPSGDYFLAYYDIYCEHGSLGSDSDPCGLMVYDRNLENGRSLLRIVGHSDPAFTADGREVLVYQDIDTDHISMLDLESGEVTTLWAIDFSHTPIGLHFSGRAFDLPGWVLVSTHDGDPGAFTWMDDQVFAVELKAGGRVVRLAHTHSLVNEDMEHDYWAEPHATVNQDFTRILFTTNWGRSGTEEVEMFMIELPLNWWALLP